MKLEYRKRKIKNYRSGVNEYLIKGEFLTSKEISKKYGVRYQTVNTRILKGLTADEIIKPIKERKTYEINGETLLSGEILKRYGISPSLLFSRYKAGKRNLELIGEIRPKASKNLITFKGEEYSAEELGRLLGLSPRTIKRRSAEGIDLDIPRRDLEKFIKVEFRGKKYNSQEISDKLGIHNTTFYNNFRKGLTVEEINNKFNKI